jgi:hypothetical protein
MKRDSSTTETMSNAVLATRYLALQELRKQVRRAEARVAPTRGKRVVILPAATKASARLLPKTRNW